MNRFLIFIISGAQQKNYFTMAENLLIVLLSYNKEYYHVQTVEILKLFQTFDFCAPTMHNKNMHYA